MLQPCEIPQEVLDADETVIGNVHAFCSAVERGLFWHMWDILCAEAVALDVQKHREITMGVGSSRSKTFPSSSKARCVRALCASVSLRLPRVFVRGRGRR